MPVIGPETFRLANKVGIKGVVIKFGNVLVLNYEECLRLSNSFGLFFLPLLNKNQGCQLLLEHQDLA